MSENSGFTPTVVPEPLANGDAKGQDAKAEQAEKPEVKTTQYTVLYKIDGDGFDVLDTVIVEGNGGQKEARKIAFGHNPHVADAVKAGKSVFLAAVPTSSWKPKEIGLTPQDPKLDI